MTCCIITGAASGIGRAAAVEMSRRGYFQTLVLVSRREEMLEETRSLLAPGCDTVAMPFDLTRLEAIPELVADIRRRCGGIRCLLNIAGYTDPQPLLTTSDANLRDTYATNVFAPFVLIRECVRYMRENRGVSKILNVASTAGITERPGWLSYASSKAALASMSKTLSEELAEYNIKVYCVSPGRCATDLRRKLAPGEDPAAIMQPATVGEVICNLVAPGEQCLDGQNIIIRKK